MTASGGAAVPPRRTAGEIAGSGRAAAGGALSWLRSYAGRMDSPLATHYVVLATTALLVVIGLVMVLSSSSVKSLADGKSVFAGFQNQALFAVVGVVALLVASRVGVQRWKRLALPLLVAGIGLQLLVFVPGIGVPVKGNLNWIRIGPFTGQPSEALKLALVLSCALVLVRKQHQLHEWRHLVLALLPTAATTVGLVLLGRDLGTAMVMMMIVAGMLWVAGVPLRFFALAGTAGAAIAVLLIAVSDNRRRRVAQWLDGTPVQGADLQGYAWQPVHGQYALASGGWWGVGLGASREKWQWLPEADNDYIFAIIGEELGLPGTLVVLLLFAVLGLACLRLARRSEDMFVKLATAGIMTWILGQAMVNIGVVLDLLPVIGVPLPLISRGGSALVMVLAAIGVLLAFARSEPGAAEALRTRPSVVRRSLAVLPRPREAGSGARRPASGSTRAPRPTQSPTRTAGGTPAKSAKAENPVRKSPKTAPQARRRSPAPGGKQR
ncbi:cell division protein FtsW [Kineococcus xinjiangensis]|uniref:Probable peptidoglycan glycosyltransferase FtsW n=1 Tax=Kineococcus xinjiangensis TaxID=512762 RepID=A0A2S6IM39_9ACTN|nr:putative lipid II flippase FtsW [Kineococcus xinjiangensis]PPK95236.1 cell division protein FtsW [Kineococcus xinjiangensis]